MTIMEAKPTPPADEAKDKVESEAHAEAPDKKESVESDRKKDNMFSDENISKDTKVDLIDPLKDAMDAAKEDLITVTPLEKGLFIDAMVNNKRYMKDYVLFGGKVTLTVRSLTIDEVDAMSTWIVKKGVSDSSGLLTGKYRKYLMAAQVEKLNGVEMPPLEEPLYETLDEDGKTVKEPGWIKRGAFWDNMSYGLFNAIMECLKDFDKRYSALCKKAENANFWNPDTPSGK